MEILRYISPFGWALIANVVLWSTIIVQIVVLAHG